MVLQFIVCPPWKHKRRNHLHIWWRIQRFIHICLYVNKFWIKIRALPMSSYIQFTLPPLSLTPLRFSFFLRFATYTLFYCTLSHFKVSQSPLIRSYTRLLIHQKYNNNNNKKSPLQQCSCK